MILANITPDENLYFKPHTYCLKRQKIEGIKQISQQWDSTHSETLQPQSLATANQNCHTLDTVNKPAGHMVQHMYRQKEWQLLPPAWSFVVEKPYSLVRDFSHLRK